MSTGSSLGSGPDARSAAAPGPVGTGDLPSVEMPSVEMPSVEMPSVEMELGWLKDRIRDVPDFPKPGVTYKDITPLLADHRAFAACIGSLTAHFADQPIDKVIGIEARGFILAAPVAQALGAGFIPVRKAGKLPWKVASATYALEYGTDTLEIHRDALVPGERVLIVDDVLATGGTAAATAGLIRSLGAEVVGFGCIIELAFLDGRAKLTDLPVVALVSYA